MSAGFDRLSFDAPFVRTDGQSRSLHFTLGEVQSTMRVDRPDELQIDYTRTMMGFLLLSQAPAHIGMIGLGGGSLIKFCHRYLPATRITVVENNPHVIALRDAFSIPPDDARLSVVQDDGADHVLRSSGDFDVLLIDAFGTSGQPASLCSRPFYDRCAGALTPDGVLVVNLHADDADHALHIQRIAASFSANAMQVLAAEKSNCIVFASREKPVTLQALRDLSWSRVLDSQARRQLRGEFARIGWEARALGAPCS